MITTRNRRDFLRAGAAATLALTSSTIISTADAPPEKRIKKSLVFGMIPNEGSIEDRFKIARDAGFDAIQGSTMVDPKEVETYKAASEKTGVAIESLICSKHWSHPLSDPNPKVAEESVESMRLSIKNAKDVGADMVLLVPAVVKPDVSYKDAYVRSQAKIRELVPLAEELKITIAVEEVWNKFLLSPLEFKKYIEEINSPYVRAWFDVGNVVLYAYPQDWIRTLGKDLIARVHIKDFHYDKKLFTPLYEGSVDWPEVMKAFNEIGYTGYFTAELGAGNLDYLKEVAKRMDRIIAGQ